MTDYASLPPIKDGEIFVPKITVEENAYRKGQLPTLDSYLDSYDPLSGLEDNPFLFAAEAASYQSPASVYQVDEAR